ncbi:MAG: nucleotidyltransferase substrate binding protein [Candidatus Aureabacteria bacterium]|nr:nucleotidyltransferase substrate binding protein [Candidatus Auribacterota bacterium]
MATDIRWKQRFHNFEKAFNKLTEALERTKDSDDDLLQSGCIQTYEFTFELAWNTLKDYLEEQGFINIKSPSGAIRQAFNSGYIKNAELWLKALKDRNLTSHTYNESVADKVIKDIRETYYFLLRDLYLELKKEIEG